MITIVSGTNRSENLSVKVAAAVQELLTSLQTDHQLLDLRKLPKDFSFRNDVFGNADPGFSAISNQFIANADRFVFVVPEYNGSFPGVLKTFIDAVWPEQFHGKKAMLVGLSSGRSGNLRGLDHLCSVLHYHRMPVLPSRLHLDRIETRLVETEHGQTLRDEDAQRLLRLLAEFTRF